MHGFRCGNILSIHPVVRYPTVLSTRIVLPLSALLQLAVYIMRAGAEA
jgi:hypothetical protein